MTRTEARYFQSVCERFHARHGILPNVLLVPAQDAIPEWDRDAIERVLNVRVIYAAIGEATAVVR